MQPRPTPHRAWHVLRIALLGLAATTLGAPALGQRAAAANSELDAPLFYQLLIGEMQLASGEPGTAYEVIMDAARRTRDDQLFRRAAEIALQARQAEQALSTARAWRAARPQSSEALRLEVQVLLATDRGREAVEPIRTLIRQAPEADRSALLAALPRSFARGGAISRGSAELLDQVIEPFVGDARFGVAARVASGQAWLAAGDADRAYQLADAAHRTDPSSIPAALLAMDLMARKPAAEQWVQAHLALPAAEASTRLAYARTLMGAQRHADALRQLERVTTDKPELATPWLTQGALQLELRQFAASEASLQRYLSQAAAEKQAAVAAGKASAPVVDDEEGEEGADRHADGGLHDAYLLLARSAEQRGDAPAAEAWLARVEDPRRLIEVQTRRATLLARQGRVEEARQAIRRAPERTTDDARSKLMAEAAVLREVKQWGEAYGVLSTATQRFADDADLLYEQSMLAEKLNRFDEAEHLLRRVIALKPDHAHAFNALGYSLADRGQRLPEARDLIARALELTPGDPFITDSLGWVEFRLGNHAEALRLLRQAWTARPDAEIGAHLGEVLWTLGQAEAAKAAWREALQLDGSNETLRETLARLKVRL